jgi:23S rRNA pseudouridine1911/1915/1917 synthase
MQQWRVGIGQAGSRLDKFLAGHDRLQSRARAVSALRRGKIFLNDREATAADAGRLLDSSDIVRLWMDRPGSSRTRRALGEDHDLPIVFEDDALVVLNKPPGLLAVPLDARGEARSVFEDLKDDLLRRGRRRPLVVHRIDRDTSGLVVFAKSAAAREGLKAQFKRREAERVYLAVVYGHPAPRSGTWRDRLAWDERALIQRETHSRDPRGKEATSQYRVVERLRGAALVEVRLVSGRRHQIRLQARLRGHTLVGEQRYSAGPGPFKTIAFPRQALHAWRLAFKHPVAGRELRFEAPLPDDMQGLIERLRRTR